MKLTRIASALALLIVWLAIAGVGGPTFGKISEVSTNDKSTFLPATAESTRAGELAEEFSDNQGVPAIITGKVNEVDDGALESGMQALDSIEGILQVIGPQISEDGEAVEYIALIDTESADPTEVVENYLQRFLARDLSHPNTVISMFLARPVLALIWPMLSRASTASYC